jgi:tRNA pseudouridine55 synthase
MFLKYSQVFSIMLINVYKPIDWTSFDVIQVLKRSIPKDLPKRIKIGHAGTLDPLASGVLIVAVGRESTKDIDLIQAQTKEYVADITLGATTKTYDLEYFPDQIEDTSNISKKEVEQTLLEFIGIIEQKPPIYSAIKIEGKPAYKLARKGKIEEKDIESKQVEINSIDLLNYSNSSGITTFTIKVTCSKGTYIRSLANDIGKSLKCGAFLSSLERTKVGNYNLQDCYTIEKAGIEISKFLNS